MGCAPSARSARSPRCSFFSSNATKFVDTSTENLLGPTRGPPTRGLHHPLSSGQFWIFEVRFEIVFFRMYCSTVAFIKFDGSRFSLKVPRDCTFYIF
jgi:hypothetical protein